MSIISENIIPGNHGQTFETNAKLNEDLERIKDVLLKNKAIKDVLIDADKYPVEITVHTNEMVAIKDVQHEVEHIGFHIIEKFLFGL